MSSALLHLPQLVTYEVLGQCSTKDLANFATCSKECYDLAKHFLWESMKIQWALFTDTTTVLQKTKYMALTKSLTIYSGFISENDKMLGIGQCAFDGLSIILHKCDAAKLKSLQFQYHIPDGGLKLAARTLEGLEELAVHNVNLPDDEWCCISKFRKLRILSVYNCNINNDTLSHIAKLSKTLRELEIRNCAGIDSEVVYGCAGSMEMLEDFTFDMELDPDDESNGEQYGNYPPVDAPDTLASFFKNSGLRHLQLCHGKLQDEIFEDISVAFSSLRVLNIDDSTKYFTDALLKHVTKLKELESLTMLAHKITDKGLSYLSMCQKLESLTIRNLSYVTDEGLRYLVQMPSLKCLSMSLQESCQVSNEGIKILSASTTLTSLHLNLCNHQRINNEGIKYLPLFPAKLEALSLNQSQLITDQALSHIGKITSLRSLSIYWCAGITDAGMEHVSKLVNLRTLNIGNLDITSAGLRFISNLSLEELRFNYNGDNDGLLCLSKMTSLIALDLISCYEVSDTGLKHLLGLQNLRLLDLYCNPQITEEGVKQLSVLPSLKWLNLEECNLSASDLVGLSKCRTVVHDVDDYHVGGYYAYEGEVNNHIHPF